MWVCILKSDITKLERNVGSLEEDNSRLDYQLDLYRTTSNELEDKYNELYSASECFIDGSTDWSDCVAEIPY